MRWTCTSYTAFPYPWTVSASCSDWLQWRPADSVQDLASLLLYFLWFLIFPLLPYSSAVALPLSLFVMLLSLPPAMFFIATHELPYTVIFSCNAGELAVCSLSPNHESDLPRVQTSLKLEALPQEMRAITICFGQDLYIGCSPWPAWCPCPCWAYGKPGKICSLHFLVSFPCAHALVTPKYRVPLFLAWRLRPAGCDLWWWTQTSTKPRLKDWEGKPSCHHRLPWWTVASRGLCPHCRVPPAQSTSCPSSIPGAAQGEALPLHLSVSREIVTGWKTLNTYMAAYKLMALILSIVGIFLFSYSTLLLFSFKLLAGR